MKKASEGKAAELTIRRTVSFPKELWTWLSSRARNEYISVAAVIRRLVIAEKKRARKGR